MSNYLSNASCITYKGKNLYSPKYDFIFKGLFGREESKVQLMSFLNSVLKEDIKNPDEIEFQNIEVPSDDPEDKQSRYDLSVVINNGEYKKYVLIDMQMTKRENNNERFVYYLNKKVASLVKVGDEYSAFVVIQLVLEDYIYFNDTDRYLSTVKLIVEEDLKVLTDIQKFIIIELPKLPKLTKDSSMMEMWLAFINCRSAEEYAILETNSIIKNSISDLQKISADEYTRRQIELREKIARDRGNDLAATARISRAEGFTEGKAEGIDIGKVEGKAEGISQVAKNMRNSDIPIDLISATTGLTREEVLAL